MAQRGHQVVFPYQPNYDVLLASPAAPWRYLLDAKRRGKKIVQRLDGVYYPTTTAGWHYPLDNARLAVVRHVFAGATIYQSAYSRRCVDRFLGTSHQPAMVIYNGVDLEHFSPDGPHATLRDTPDQHVFITASRFRRHDQIIPLLAAFQTYREHHHANSTLVIIGNFVGTVADVPKKYAHDVSLRFLGIIPNQQLPQYLRAADVFLFTHLNPPCPNNVIEAIACGLPIGGVADGGMPELIHSGVEGELLPTDGDAFYRPRQYEASEVARRMARIMDKREAYAAAARQRAEAKYGLEHMIDQYRTVLQ